ncbi:hypothetical protein EZS27_029432 [termite gut metagenome]|uniref:Transposase IS4-like domain-containing protein n=1 Tax=termite gut metagenome TaxID=433724 RepID=A0A5J4QIY3_9ZZZZ
MHRYTIHTQRDLSKDSDKRQILHADSACSDEPIVPILKSKEIENQIHEKGYRGKLLTDEQKASNKTKSKTRVRVEHIFGFIEQKWYSFSLYFCCKQMKD